MVEMSVCKTCTIQLNRLCCQRAWWFGPFREVLAAGIRLFALIHRIDPEDYPARSKACHRCIRFRKNVLKERSALFRRLHERLNPLFDRVQDSLLTAGEREEARKRAREASEGRLA